jgi:hypothetical protein
MRKMQIIFLLLHAIQKKKGCLTPKGPETIVQAFLEVWAGHCEGHIYQKFMN